MNEYVLNWRKIWISMIVLTVILLGAWPGAGIREAKAAEVFGDYEYVDNGNRTATITGYKKSGGAVEIPSSIGLLKVISIGNYAFSDKRVSSVIIPNSVTSIGDYAFYHNQLSSVTIPNSVTSIGEYAFTNNQLSSVTIPNSVTSIGEYAFTNNQLSSVTIPNSVTSISDYAFTDNQISSVTIPNSVTSIGDAAFAYNQIRSVNILNGVTSIGDAAFLSNQLTSLTIPNSITSIGNAAFAVNQISSIIIESTSLTTFGVDAFSSNKFPTFIGYDNARNYAKAIGYNFKDIWTVSIDPNSNSTWAQSHSGVVTASSYIDGSLAFKWAQSVDRPDSSGWKAFKSGDSIVTPLETGEWYLHVRFTDHNGFESYDHSNAFKVDQTSPDIQISVDLTDPTNQYVMVTAAVNDAQSEIEVTKWASGDYPAAYFGTGGTLFNESFEVDENGTYTVYAKDAAGNESVATIQVTNIYTDKPTILLTIAPKEPTQGNVSVTAAVYAQSGIEELKVGQGQQDISYFAAGGTPLSITDGEADIVVPDNGWISVYASDHAGNQVVKQLEVTNIDREKPVIVLKGDAVVEVRLGTSYTDPGYSAMDNYDGDVTAQVIVSDGIIDTSKPGQYTINYDVSDRAGNAAERVSRTVKVIAAEGMTVGGGGRPSLSNNTDLSKLELWANDQMIPLIKSGTTSYTTETEASQIELRAITAQASARLSLKLNGEALGSDKNLSLKAGGNLLELIVQAEDGTTKTYTITIHRNVVKRDEAIELSDISGHWAEKQIRQAIMSNIVSGYPDGTFHPNASVTRAEFVVMLMKAIGQSENKGGGHTFSDAFTVGDWAKSAIAQAAAVNIVSGYPDGSFRPNERITRAEMAVMVAKAFGVEPSLTNSGFADDASIPTWARGTAEALRQVGVLQGRSGGKFAPSAEASRAEALTIILRLLDMKLT
ncbi:leucine-rich repeat protein [Paenibacillus dendrobii]|nr:leucine-rich repeat protein [Paenibacillus dendrobii]